jgi:hypothetical protein
MVDDWPGRIVYDAMMVQSCAYLLIPFQLYLLIYLRSLKLSFLKLDKVFYLFCSSTIQVHFFCQYRGGCCQRICWGGTHCRRISVHGFPPFAFMIVAPCVDRLSRLLYKHFFLILLCYADAKRDFF